MFGENDDAVEVILRAIYFFTWNICGEERRLERAEVVCVG
jgi:hypothetical protein